MCVCVCVWQSKDNLPWPSQPFSFRNASADRHFIQYSHFPTWERVSLVSRLHAESEGQMPSSL